MLNGSPSFRGAATMDEWARETARDLVLVAFGLLVMVGYCLTETGAETRLQEMVRLAAIEYPGDKLEVTGAWAKAGAVYLRACRSELGEDGNWREHLWVERNLFIINWEVC